MKYRHPRLLSWLVGAALGLALASPVSAQTHCTDEQESFEARQFKVNSVEARTMQRSLLSSLGVRTVTGLPIVAGEPFRCADYLAAWGQVAGKYMSLLSGQNF